MSSDVKRKLQNMCESVAREITEHGAESLYTEGQFVISGKIIIEINELTEPVVVYEKTVTV